MSVKAGQVWERNNSKQRYVVLAVDGNNPKVPTNTPMVHLIWQWKKKGLFSQMPQEFISIPLKNFETYFDFVSETV